MMRESTRHCSPSKPVRLRADAPQAKPTKKDVKAKQAKDPKAKKDDKASKGPKKKAGNANTGPIFYFSNGAVTKACKADKQKIKDECDTEDGKKKSQTSKADTAKANKGGKLGKMAGAVSATLGKLDSGAKLAYGYKPNDANAWVGDHCKGLWLKPMGSDNIGQFQEQIGKIKDMYQNLAADVLNQAKNMGLDLLKDVAMKKLEKIAIREGVAIAAAVTPTGVGQVVGVGLTAYNVLDTAGTAIGVGAAAISQAGALSALKDKLLAQAKDLTDKVDTLKKLLSPEGVNDVMADVMSGVAYGNACIKARKCMLVPFDETTTAKKQAKNGKGCCPGQTGHHVLPDAMFRKPGQSSDLPRDKKETLDCWKNYSEGGAPTVCLEGTSNSASNGSHGAAHAMTKKIIDKHRSESEMKYTEARDEIAEGLALAYGCDVNCLKAQLNKYYCEAYTCGKPGQNCTQKLNDAKVYPHDGNPGGGGTLPSAAPRKKKG
jgi:GHH signature containing HNH/Endo VII superfamily nuclease toxin  2